MNAQSSRELARVLSEDRILVLDHADKAAVLNKLVDCLGQTDQITDVDDLRSGIFHREELMSTGIGLGIGVPHVRRESVRNLILAVAVVKHPIENYEALDNMPVHAVFMIAAGKNQHTDHIHMLSVISTQFKDRKQFDALLAAETPAEVYALLTENGN